jgi:hypothetical protein
MMAARPFAGILHKEAQMLECLVMLIVWVIIAIIVLYILETVLAPFISLPPPVYMLIRLLIGLLVLIAFLNCCGFFGAVGHDGNFGLYFTPRH